MRIPHIRTLAAYLATVGALSGLLATKIATHRPLTPALAAKSVQGTGSDAIVTLTGPPVPIAHGVVQVRITVAGGRITTATATRLPHDNDVSWHRSEQAAQILAGEVLTAQSAHIDVVSGATFTSQAYRTSLQAAVDAAAPELEAP